MIPRLSSVAAAALLASLVLTGCGAATGGNGASGGNGAATSGPANEDTDGGDTGLEGETTISATFPTADVPLIEGDVAYSQDLGTGWVVYIHRDDFLAGWEEASGLLLDAGFTGNTAGSDDTGSVGQFTTDTYTVNLSAGDGSGLGVGPSVGYTVVKN